MKRGWIVGLAVLVGLAGNGVYAVWARAEGPRPAAAGATKVGKYLLVHVRVTNTVMAVEQAEVQVIGGKPFLVGMGATGGEVRTPATGRPVWVSLEDASTVIHFDSIEDLEKAVASAPRLREH